MTDLMPVELVIHARRNRALVVLLRSRVLCLEVAHERRRAQWLRARARYLWKKVRVSS